MSEFERDSVLNYRPGPESELPLDAGETVVAVFTSDRRRYWVDHATMAALGGVAVAMVLPLFGNAGQVPVGLVATAAAVGLRGWWLASEQFARRWQLTDRRLIGPQGRQVMLLEIASARRLMGDVQIVTKSGGKHLIKHLADSAHTIDAIKAAREARAREVR